MILRPNQTGFSSFNDTTYKLRKSNRIGITYSFDMPYCFVASNYNIFNMLSSIGKLKDDDIEYWPVDYALDMGIGYRIKIGDHIRLIPSLMVGFDMQTFQHSSFDCIAGGGLLVEFKFERIGFSIGCKATFDIFSYKSDHTINMRYAPFAGFTIFFLYNDFKI